MKSALSRNMKQLIQHLLRKESYGKKFQNFEHFSFSVPKLVIRAGIHKILVRIANSEDPDQADLGLCCLSRPSWQTTIV